jgi:DNA excision repair protein ERCC-4
MTSQPVLPAMRSLGTLADLKPCIVRDTREQQGLTFTRLPCVTGTLVSGDYSVCGCEHLFSVEKKIIAELPGIFTGDRDRFARECVRLRGYRFRRLLVVGSRRDIDSHGYKSNVTPRAILASLSAFECRYDLPVVFTPTPESAALQVESWAFWFSREIVEECNGLLRAHKQIEKGGTNAD